MTKTANSATGARRLKTSVMRPLRSDAPVSMHNILYQGRLHGALAHRLGVDILKGVYKSGEVLPNEIESSSSLDISRR